MTSARAGGAQPTAEIMAAHRHRADDARQGIGPGPNDHVGPMREPLQNESRTLERDPNGDWYLRWILVPELSGRAQEPTAGRPLSLKTLAGSA